MCQGHKVINLWIKFIYIWDLKDQTPFTFLYWNYDLKIDNGYGHKQWLQWIVLIRSAYAQF